MPEGLLPVVGQVLHQKQTCPREPLDPVSPPGEDHMTSRPHHGRSGRARPAWTHRGDLQIVLVVALREVGQLGHPGELLVQLLEQGRRVEHLLLVGLEQLIVEPAELLRQLQGRVQLLAQERLTRVAGRTVCPEMQRTQTGDRNVKGELNRDEDKWQPGHAAGTWGRATQNATLPPSIRGQPKAKQRAGPECEAAQAVLIEKVLLLEVVSAEVNCLSDITDFSWRARPCLPGDGQGGALPHLKKDSLGAPCAQPRRSSHCPVPSGITSRNLVDVICGCYLSSTAMPMPRHYRVLWRAVMANSLMHSDVQQ